jgi:hypothetical protein
MILSRRCYLAMFAVSLLALAGGCEDSSSDTQVSSRARVEKPKDTPKPAAKPAEVDPRRTLAGHPNAHPANVSKPWEPVNTSQGVSAPNNSSGSGGFDLLAQGDDDMSRALSHVSAEISESLKLKKTLVVWLLDRSADSSGVRRSIAGQISQVAQSALARAKAHGGQGAPLYMALMGYGKTVEIATPEPTDDPLKVENAAAALGDADNTPTATFAAVHQAAEKFLPYRGKGFEMLFVIVGNNASRDWAEFDAAVPNLRRDAVPVFGIGNAVPFSRQWHAPIGGSTAEPPASIPLASMDLEGIDLSLPGGQTDIDLSDSGYGPFGLERLCRATQGRFYRLRPGNMSLGWQRDSHGDIEPEILRKYAPDYVSEKQYQEILNANKACLALHNAALQAHADALGAVTMQFYRGKDEASLARSIGLAQRAPAEKGPEVDRLYEALEPGHSDRSKLTSPRWQVEYDLAMGRLLAAKVRIDGYNAQLAVVKQGKAFANANSSLWILHQSNTNAAGSALVKMIRDSQMLLGRVIKENPGTPWAEIANRELTQSMGWEWSER